jgi:Ca-activated chloride channel family protein
MPARTSSRSTELAPNCTQQFGLHRHRQGCPTSAAGAHTSSLVSFDEVLDLASRSETAIYTIGLGRSEPGKGDRSSAQSGLTRLAKQTGGRAFFPRNIRDLAGVYGDIREELSSQYALAYESNSLSRDGQ